MRYIYNFFFFLALPFILLRLVFKARKNPEYNKRWHERLTIGKMPKLDASILVHAVSLGEAIAAIPLIRKLKAQYPNTQIVATTMTPTGSNKIQKTFGNEIIHVYIPYDYPFAIKRFLRRYNPKIVVIMETELWPNLIHYTHKNSIPIIIANARLSDHSAKSYRKLKCFVHSMLTKIDMIAAQSDLDAKRFIDLGANQNSVAVIGNIKFDIELPADLSLRADNIRQFWLANRPIFIAASTHAGEDEMVLNAFAIMKKSIPNLLLVLVPRHPERFAEATELCKQRGLQTISYIKHELCKLETDVVIGDTVGELLYLYKAADIAFVGGSLVPTGGHNLLEPAALNIPVISGNNLFNFKEISQLLINANGVIIVNSATELAESVIKLINNPKQKQQQIENAAHVIKQNQGALNRLLKQIDILNRESS